MGFRGSGGAAVAVNGVEIDGSPGEIDFIDSGSVSWIGNDAGQTVELQAFTGSLEPQNVQPGTPGMLVSQGGSGALDTHDKISPYYFVNRYKAHYDNGFRLQFRGRWYVGSSIDSVGIFSKKTVAGVETYTAIAGYGPRLTVTTVAYTDWGVVDIPPTAMADDDPLYIALGAGNNSFFFGWAMNGAIVEYRWIDTNAPAGGTEDATVLPGTIDGQVPIWADQIGVYQPGAIELEGVNVKSTGEASSLVLTSDGADGATWDAPGGANVGGCSVSNFNIESIANNAAQNLLFNQKLWDTNGYKAAGFTPNIVIPAGKGGMYVCTWSVPFLANAIGVRRAYPRVAGTDVATVNTFEVPAHPTQDTYVNGSCMIVVADGDTVNLRVYQNSGGALDTNPGGGIATPFFQLMRIGD